MSEKAWLFRVRDMVKCIDEIQSFTQDHDSVSFAEDRKTYKATERNLEIIGEASKHIPETVKALYPAIAWKQIVGIRNVISHDYDAIVEETIWLVSREKLPELKTVLLDILSNATGE